MTVKEASSVFLTGMYPLHAGANVDNQSSCFYPGQHRGVLLETNVSWSKEGLSNFTQLHSPFAISAAGVTPSGATIPAPEFIPLTVDGAAAYWVADVGMSGSAFIDHLSQMSAEKHGYLVILTSSGLTEAQDQQAMRTMLGRL